MRWSLDGTELRRGKQNRMVNVTIIVAAHSETEIPVSYVEQGRWSYRSSRFTSAKRTVASKLRGYKARKVAENLAPRGVASADQGEVWDRVSAYLCEARVESPTMAMDDLFARRDTAIGRVIEALGNAEAHSAVVALNRRLSGSSFHPFDAAETFTKVRLQLLRAHAMDAVLSLPPERAKTVARSEVDAWRHSATTDVRLTQHRVPGVGGITPSTRLISRVASRRVTTGRCTRHCSVRRLRARSEVNMWRDLPHAALYFQAPIANPCRRFSAAREQEMPRFSYTSSSRGAQNVVETVKVGFFRYAATPIPAATTPAGSLSPACAHPPRCAIWQLPPLTSATRFAERIPIFDADYPGLGVNFARRNTRGGSPRCDLAVKRH